MSPESPLNSNQVAPAAWPVLNFHERRILGVLVEKAKTTPDAYPLSVNALVTGSNQKSYREPLMDLSESDVEEALVRAQQKGLAIKITGGRVVRWRHHLYEAWNLSKVELAVLGELLLRGPQTEGELRGRASRMEPIDDIDALRAVLRPMAERRLVVYLTPEGRRGTVLTHGFHDPREVEALRARQGLAEEAAALAPLAAGGGMATAAGTITEERMSTMEAGLEDASAEIATLRSRVGELENAVTNLTEQLRGLKDALGA